MKYQKFLLALLYMCVQQVITGATPNIFPTGLNLPVYTWNTSVSNSDVNTLWMQISCHSGNYWLIYPGQNYNAPIANRAPNSTIYTKASDGSFTKSTGQIDTVIFEYLQQSPNGISNFYAGIYLFVYGYSSSYVLAFNNDKSWVVHGKLCYSGFDMGTPGRPTYFMTNNRNTLNLSYNALYFIYAKESSPAWTANVDITQWATTQANNNNSNKVTSSITNTSKTTLPDLTPQEIETKNQFVTLQDTTTPGTLIVNKKGLKNTSLTLAFYNQTNVNRKKNYTILGTNPLNKDLNAYITNLSSTDLYNGVYLYPYLADQYGHKIQKTLPKSGTYTLWVAVYDAQGLIKGSYRVQESANDLNFLPLNPKISLEMSSPNNPAGTSTYVQYGNTIKLTTNTSTSQSLSSAPNTPVSPTSLSSKKNLRSKPKKTTTYSGYFG